MWFEEVTTELYKEGIKDYTLFLTDKTNYSNDTAIHTPVGLARRENVKKKKI